MKKTEKGCLSTAVEKTGSNEINLYGIGIDKMTATKIQLKQLKWKPFFQHKAIYQHQAIHH